MRNLRSKLAQLGNLTSIKPELDLAKPKRRRARKPKNQMQVYFVSELSSESESGKSYQKIYKIQIYCISPETKNAKVKFKG